VEFCLTAGTTSLLTYLISSAVSLSRKAVASSTDLFTRAEVSPTLRLKSFIQVLPNSKREQRHAVCGRQALSLFRACALESTRRTREHTGKLAAWVRIAACSMLCEFLF